MISEKTIPPAGTTTDAASAVLARGIPPRAARPAGAHPPGPVGDVGKGMRNGNIITVHRAVEPLSPARFP
jgi:hypothetical protein